MIIYTLISGKRYILDEFTKNILEERNGRLYNISGKRPKDLGMILYKEEKKHDTSRI